MSVNISTSSPELRVFISGAFFDTHPERNYLAEHVFPKIQRYCREHSIHFSWIDIRQDVTKDQLQEGKSVATCLDEIHRRFPYILGIVGNDYGWQPTPEDLKDYPGIFRRYPWLRTALKPKEKPC